MVDSTRIITGTSWILALLTMLILVSACTTPELAGPPADSDTVRVKTGTFVSGVEDVGIIKATYSASVMASAYGKIVKLASEGSSVKKDDPVLWLDDQDIKKEINTERINLKRSKSDLDRVRESLGKTQFNLEQALKKCQANYQFDQINVERSERELKRLENRFKRKLIPETEIVRAQSDLGQKRLKETSSRLALERAQIEHDSKLKTLKTDLAISQQEYERSRFRMTELQNRLQKMVIRAPADGVVVIKKNWRKEQFKVGDRVWSGMQVLEIPDLSEFQVWTQVPEVHLQRISVDQPVTVHLPALANFALEGKVKSISWLAMPRALSRGTDFTSEDDGDGGRVFEIMISLETHDERLKTGMSVSVVFVEEHMDDVLLVPASCIATDKNGSYVYCYEADKFSLVRVETGLANNSETVIRNGIGEGQRIALFNPGKGI